MTFKQIELAIDLSRTLNYRHTAENQFISQPSLTYQIKSLEDEIGVPLFRRSSSGVALTPAGSVFCRDMAQVMAKAGEVLSAVRNCGAGFADVLRVGINGRRHASVIAEIARRFGEQAPNVYLELVDNAGSDRLDMFLRRELDGVFYITEAFAHMPHIGHTALMRSGIYCVMRRDNPLSALPRIAPADLAGSFILLSHVNAPAALGRAQAHLMRSAPLHTQLCASVETALLWIEARNGVALMPGFAHEGNERFAWVPYAWRETIPCSLAWHAEGGHPQMQTFAKIAEKTFAESSCL